MAGSEISGTEISSRSLSIFWTPKAELGTAVCGGQSRQDALTVRGDLLNEQLSAGYARDLSSSAHKPIKPYPEPQTRGGS